MRIILAQTEVGLEKDVPYLEGMTEVVVDQHQDQHPGQVQESVQTETDLDIKCVGNMTILLVIAPTLAQMRNQTGTIQTVIQFYKVWHMTTLEDQAKVKQ